MNTFHSLVLAKNPQCLLVGIAVETAAIVQKRGETLTLTHLVSHRALDTSFDVDNTLIGSYLNDIIVNKTDIAGQTAIEDELVDVDR